MHSILTIMTNAKQHTKRGPTLFSSFSFQFAFHWWCTPIIQIKHNQTLTTIFKQKGKTNLLFLSKTQTNTTQINKLFLSFFFFSFYLCRHNQQSQPLNIVFTLYKEDFIKASSSLSHDKILLLVPPHENDRKKQKFRSFFFFFIATAKQTCNFQENQFQNWKP